MIPVVAYFVAAMSLEQHLKRINSYPPGNVLRPIISVGFNRRPPVFSISLVYGPSDAVISIVVLAGLSKVACLQVWKLASNIFQGHITRIRDPAPTVAKLAEPP